MRRPRSRRQPPLGWGTPSKPRCSPGAPRLTELAQQHLACVLDVVVLVQLGDVLIQLIHTVASGSEGRERESFRKLMRTQGSESNEAST